MGILNVGNTDRGITNSVVNLKNAQDGKIFHFGVYIYATTASTETVTESLVRTFEENMYNTIFKIRICHLLWRDPQRYRP